MYFRNIERKIKSISLIPENNDVMKYICRVYQDSIGLFVVYL